MKVIKSEDLIVGQEYYNRETTDLNKATVMKFIEFDDEGDPTFKYVKGNNGLAANKKGYIPFFSASKFYQP